MSCMEENAECWWEGWAARAFLSFPTPTPHPGTSTPGPPPADLWLTYLSWLLWEVLKVS